MKIRLALGSLAALLSLAGCGKSGSSDSAAASTAGAPAGPREIDLTASDAMKYDTTAIAAKPGEELKVVLTNIGTIPVEVMGHNWILLKPGADAGVFSAAAAAAKDTKYIPADHQGEIIAKIDLLGPRKSGEVDFKAPDAPGEYPFLCSFPGHFQAGMHGILTVK